MSQWWSDGRKRRWKKSQTSLWMTWICRTRCSINCRTRGHNDNIRNHWLRGGVAFLNTIILGRRVGGSCSLRIHYIKMLDQRWRSSLPHQSMINYWQPWRKRSKMTGASTVVLSCFKSGFQGTSSSRKVGMKSPPAIWAALTVVGTRWTKRSWIRWRGTGRCELSRWSTLILICRRRKARLRLRIVRRELPVWRSTLRWSTMAVNSTWACRKG